MSWGGSSTYQGQPAGGYRPGGPVPGQYGQPPPQYGQQPPPQYGQQPPPQHAQQPPQYGQQPPPQRGQQPPQYGQPPPQYGGYGGQQTAAPRAPPPQTGYGGGPGGYPGGYAPPAPPAPPAGVSQELWGWFQSVDADKSGEITSKELQQALHNGNWTPFNGETCRLMIGMFDRDRTGTIDIQEFSALWKYIQDWKSCFDRFDTDRSGNISADELFNAFRTFGYNLSMNFVQLCIRVFDRHKRGNINFDDFIQCCVLLKTLTEQFRQKDAQQNGVVTIQYEEFLKMVLDAS